MHKCKLQRGVFKKNLPPPIFNGVNSDATANFGAIGLVCSKLKVRLQTVSVQAQPVCYPSQPGHNPPGSKCHTGTEAQLINLAITQALNATQGHKHRLTNKQSIRL